jgi:hypothetical protein
MHQQHTAVIIETVMFYYLAKLVLPLFFVVVFGLIAQANFLPSSKYILSAALVAEFPRWLNGHKNF